MVNVLSLIKSMMVLVSVSLMATSVLAQDDLGDMSEESEPATSSAAPQNQVQKGKRTTIDFEDELVEGKTKNPELFYLLQKRQFNYKRLIRLRENFLPEMRKTSEDISSRKGSGQ